MTPPVVIGKEAVTDAIAPMPVPMAVVGAGFAVLVSEVVMMIVVIVMPMRMSVAVPRLKVGKVALARGFVKTVTHEYLPEGS